jgi:hypothetical protein
LTTSSRTLSFDENILEADILSLAERMAEMGLSDLNEHTAGVNMSFWDMAVVRMKLEDLMDFGGRTATDARSALDRLEELR